MATESDVETYFSGNDAVLHFTATDEDTGAALDLSGALALEFALAKSASGTAIIEKDLTDGVNVTDAVAGEFDVIIDAADTELLKGVHYYEVRLTNAEGKKVTLAYGAFPITVNLIRD